jgi:hypothetical protein
MSTYTSAESNYGPVIRNSTTGLMMNSYSNINERNLTTTDTKKNIMFQEVDAEIKKLRCQFDSVNNDDNIHNKVSGNSEDQRTYGIRINNTSRHLVANNEKATINNSLKAN